MYLSLSLDRVAKIVDKYYHILFWYDKKKKIVCGPRLLADPTWGALAGTALPLSLSPSLSAIIILD